MHKRVKKQKGGFTIIESIVAVALFVIIGMSIYKTYLAVLDAMAYSRHQSIATSLANEQLEIIRNLPYTDVGIVAGIPSGKIPKSQYITRNNVNFFVDTTIRNTDDPFDGVLSGTPNDTSPADYKLVEINLACLSCKKFHPVKFVTYVGPKNLETASTNGALFVEVFDAVGQPISGADVHIENNLLATPVVIDDQTNNDGLLQIVDAPPSPESYEVTVTKPGYSSERTYTVGTPENPNPAKPHATVLQQQVTQLSFVIDKLSVLDFSSATQACGVIPGIDFVLTGTKQIGTSPDVLKYSATQTTDGIGEKMLPDIEWDTYQIDFVDGTYDLAGTIPLTPLFVNPNSTQEVKLIVVPKNPNSLLVAIQDASTQLPLSGVSVKLEAGAYDETLITDRGFIRQTDWSGGAGQENFLDSTQYADSDGNIENAIPAGDIRLLKILDQYQSSGSLVSSTFDTGSASNFHQILWQPQDQPIDTGVDSARFQVATNNDNLTWQFLGPDGTAGTFYTPANQNIHSIHDGDRYFRYKAFLQTASTTWTPDISDVSFTFTSSCVPPGQVLFENLSNQDYTLTISKSGYQDSVQVVRPSLDWQRLDVTLLPS